MEMQKEKYFKTIIILAVPMIVENLFQTLLGTVDTYFAGHIGDLAIAAIGLTSLIMNILITFYGAVSIGTSTVISRYVGEGNMKKAGEVVRQSVILSLLIGGILGILSLVFYGPLLRMTGGSEEILQYAIPYYLIVAVPSFLICLSMTLSSCLRAVKNTRVGMISTIVGNILNIILNYLFIKAGFGIIGLGIATTISRVVMVMILVVYLVRGYGGLKLSFRKWRMEKDILFSISKIGIPACLEKLVMRLGQLVYNGMIISLGTAAFVAHNIASTVENYSYIPAYALSLVAATLVGISLGEHQVVKAKKYTWRSFILTMLLMVFIGSVFFIFAPQLAGLFTQTKEVQEMVVSVLRLIALFQPFAALTQVLTGALQGAGDARFPMYATMAGIWGIRVGLGYLLAVYIGLGLFGVWIAYALDITFRGLLLLIRFRRGKWETIKI